MTRLRYLGIIKEYFSVYSSTVMLVSGKVTKDKRAVTDFRYLNVRVAKTNILSVIWWLSLIKIYFMQQPKRQCMDLIHNPK